MNTCVTLIDYSIHQLGLSHSSGVPNETFKRIKNGRLTTVQGGGTITVHDAGYSWLHKNSHACYSQRVKSTYDLLVYFVPKSLESGLPLWSARCLKNKHRPIYLIYNFFTIFL